MVVGDQMKCTPLTIRAAQHGGMMEETPQIKAYPLNSNVFAPAPSNNCNKEKLF